MKHVIWIGTEAEIEEVGGKALNLSRMAENHVPVPPAFFVTTGAYTSFLDHNNLNDVIIAPYDSNQQKSETIMQKIREGTIPSDVQESILSAYELLGSNDNSSNSIIDTTDVDVAVRSSATAEDLPGASFAGQQASFLNIKGAQNVLDSVRECWASLYTERAIAYRENQKITSAQMCVVVQKMVHSERSGVMFTQDPTSGTEQMLIQAVTGLGESIVSGERTPDSYLHRDGKVIVQDTPTGVQLLDDREVNELARIGRKIQRIYGCPQDIEWAWDDDLYIVQTRNVTVTQKESNHDIEGDVLLNGNIASRGVASGPVRIIRSMDDVRNVEDGDVMVTEMTMPDMVPGMMKCAAIITERGGATCHAAIVSRELGIPCLVGVDNALSLPPGQTVTVDAENGVVTTGATTSSTTTQKHTSDTTVFAIIDIPQMAQKCADAGFNGVGLVRLELIIAAAGKHPLWYKNRGQLFQYGQHLESQLRMICEAFPTQKIFVRSSDLRSDEYTNLEGAPAQDEDNPMLGMHAVRFAQKHPEIFRAECQAIARLQKEYPNLALMVPFVVNRTEVEWAKSVYREYSEAWFGCMVETPAACLNFGAIKDLVDFVSFGTNDLTQLTLGVDRNNDRVQYLFNEQDPSVLSLIDMVIDSGVYTSMCGNAATNKAMLSHIIGRITSISIPYGALGEVEESLQHLTSDSSATTGNDHAS